MKKNYLLIWVLLNCFGCHSPAPESANPEKVVYEAGSFESMLSSELFSRITLIPVETSPEIIIGGNLALYVTGANYFVVDYFKKRKAYRLDLNGKFLNTIGNPGDGPGEYASLSDFAPNPDKNEVYMYSNRDAKEYVYNLSGNFLDRKDLSLPFYKAMPVIDGTWTYLGYDNPRRKGRIIKVNKEGKIVKEFLDEGYHVLSMDEATPVFFKKEDVVYVRETMNAMVYAISQDKIAPVYAFDFGNYQIPEEYFHQASAMQAAELLFSRDRAIIRRFMQNNHYAIVEVMVQKTNGEEILSYGIKNLQKGKWQWFTISMNQQNEERFVLNIQSLNDRDELFCLMEPAQLIQFPHKDIFKNQEVISGIKEEDNLVILKCKLR